MNKSITLSKNDWNTIIEGLSYAAEQAEEVAEMYPEAQNDADAYTALINLIHESIA